MNSVIKHNINKNNVAILRLNCTREMRYFIGNCAAWVVVEKKACFALGQGISSKFDSDNEERLSYKSFSKMLFSCLHGFIFYSVAFNQRYEIHQNRSWILLENVEIKSVLISSCFLLSLSIFYCKYERLRRGWNFC